MRTIIARFNIQPGKETEAEEAMKMMAAAVEANETGALAYIFLRNRKVPLEVAVFEMYADGDAFAAHGASAHMAAFRPNFGVVFDPASVKIDSLDRVAGFTR